MNSVVADYYRGGFHISNTQIIARGVRSNLKRGTPDLRLLPTDAVLNILMMDSYHATSKVVVLPQAGNVWKRIGVIRVADNLRQ